jgi:hypothetical protein
VTTAYSPALRFIWLEESVAASMRSSFSSWCIRLSIMTWPTKRIAASGLPSRSRFSTPDFSVT